MGAAAQARLIPSVDPHVARAVPLPGSLRDWADDQLRALAPAGLDGLRGSDLLLWRAAITGYVSRGPVSPGGSCRLLEAAGGWIALNLARSEDWDLLPAWLEEPVAADWDAVAVSVRSRPVRALVERGHEMGLAVALDEVPPVDGECRQPESCGTSHADPRSGATHRSVPPRVVDLSSLWAGPLCGYLLQRMGAEVVKVESRQRPDGARRGSPLFFDLLNGGKTAVVLDFGSAEGRGQLRALLETADIVIEGSRPRALRQLGIDAEALCARRPELVWVGITAYGRGPRTENRVGYGDDVGVAAGLSARVRRDTGERRIVGDAIADPLTGLYAARLAWQAWTAGRGGLHDIAMFDVVRRACEKWPRRRPFEQPMRPLVGTSTASPALEGCHGR